MERIDSIVAVLVLIAGACTEVYLYGSFSIAGGLIIGTALILIGMME